MRLAMVIDAQRLAVEQRLLNRLGVGLMAEGVELVRIVPENLRQQALDEGERRIGLAQRVEAPMRVLPWLRGARWRRVAEALDDAPPDVLYLLGSQTWRLGGDLAAALDRPVLIDVHSPAEVQAAPRPQADGYIAGYVAPCEGIAKHAIARFGSDLVHVVPMGVSPNRRVRAVLSKPERSPAIAILGSASEVDCYLPLFEGLAELAKSQLAVEVILELRGPREHEIWRHAERMGLLSMMTTIGSASQHRPLLTRCDVVAWPEHRGELRSILLEVMAAGIPVATARDPSLDMLRDGVTARVVQQDTGADWAAALREMLNSPDDARALGLRGREHVTQHHRSSEQVAAMQTLLERVGRSAFAFPTSQT